MTWFSDPLFGVAITFLTFELGVYLNKRTGLEIMNPLLISILLIIALIKGLHIDLGDYQKGGSLITFFIKPATVALAIPLYKHFDLLIKHFKSVIIGVLSGVLTSFASLTLLTKWLVLPEHIIISSMGRNITTPIGMELTKQLGGIVPITVAMIFFTGIYGSLVGPWVLKFFRIRHRTAMGIALGTASHVVGTSKAITLGEDIGAMSAVAIPIAGIMTVLLAPLVLKFI